MIQWMTDLLPFAQEHGLTNVLFSGVDARQGMTNEDREAIEKAIRSSPDLITLYQTETATVYKFH